jgi:outer membrane beta-barrel protein
LAYTTPVYAQNNEEENINEVESIMDKDDDRDTEEVAAPSKGEEAIPDSISNLKNLQPFSDVAVIQRKFLPKTKRFEFNAGGSAIVNNAFFMNFGPSLRLGYNFSENLGFDVMFMYLTTSNRDITNDLIDKRGVRTDGLVMPETYLGGNLVWTPVYGKMALFENRIVPFDMYFMLGAGGTVTCDSVCKGLVSGQSKGKETNATIQIGAGQRFAISKKMAFRWDFTWNFYQASYTPAYKTGPPPPSQKGNFDNLFLSIGLSFFFPEASYR